MRWQFCLKTAKKKIYDEAKSRAEPKLEDVIESKNAREATFYRPVAKPTDRRHLPFGFGLYSNPFE